MTIRGFCAGCVLASLAFLPIPLARGDEPAAEVPSSAAEVRPLEVGARVPDVELTAPDGEPVDLRTAIAKQPTVLIFYRGGW